MTTVQDIRNKVKMFRPTSQEVNLFDPNLNDYSTRLFKFKDDQENRFKIWVFTDTLKLETPLTTSLLFSINFPDKVCLAKKLLFEESGIGKIFTNDSKDDQVKLCIKLLNDDLKSLDFDYNEGLTVYRNALQVTLKQDRQLLPEIEIFKKIKSLIEHNFPDETDEIALSDLPTYNANKEIILNNKKGLAKFTELKEDKIQTSKIFVIKSKDDYTGFEKLMTDRPKPTEQTNKTLFG
jgi:hypothetical protein